MSRGHKKRHFRVSLVHEPPFHDVISNDDSSMVHHKITAPPLIAYREAY
jgi:hypothetical protein